MPNGLKAGLGTDWLRSRFAFVADLDRGMRARAPVVAVADLAGDVGGFGCCCWLAGGACCGRGVFLGMRLPPWVDSSTPLS